MFGKKQVFLRITDKTPGKKPELPPPLVEGDICGRVKVVSIYPDKDQVVVSIDGNEQTVTFRKEPPKPVPTPVPQVPRPQMRRLYPSAIPSHYTIISRQ